MIDKNAKRKAKADRVRMSVDKKRHIETGSGHKTIAQFCTPVSKSCDRDPNPVTDCKIDSSVAENKESSNVMTVQDYEDICGEIREN